MSSSYTRSTTQTSTQSKVIHVTRKVQADLLAILDHYGYFSEDYAQKLINDIRVFIDEEAIEQVKFTWTRLGSNVVVEELDYKVVWGDIGLADDRSGSIRYRFDLTTAKFQVRTNYSDRWRRMPEDQKKLIREDLKLQWKPANRLDYTGGQWSAERSYSKDGLGLNRSRFTRL
ncbi:hypothetical protein ACQ4N7_29570 [Nodosilinea sp. AN01ver1]|uniref:HORMA-1 domain-containing protein n=1 Tax=Nodosilinea sp. AN01ver1 TaxID=3423362 RepID=UPI003D323752